MKSIFFTRRSKNILMSLSHAYARNILSLFLFLYSLIGGNEVSCSIAENDVEDDIADDNQISSAVFADDSKDDQAKTSLPNTKYCNIFLNQGEYSLRIRAIPLRPST